MKTLLLSKFIRSPTHLNCYPTDTKHPCCFCTNRELKKSLVGWKKRQNNTPAMPYLFHQTYQIPKWALRASITTSVMISSSPSQALSLKPQPAASLWQRTAWDITLGNNYWQTARVCTDKPWVRNVGTTGAVIKRFRSLSLHSTPAPLCDFVGFGCVCVWVCVR